MKLETTRPEPHLEAAHDVRASWPATMIGFVHQQGRDGAAEIFDTRVGDGDGDIEELHCWTCDVDLELEGLEWA